MDAIYEAALAALFPGRDAFFLEDVEARFGSAREAFNAGPEAFLAKGILNEKQAEGCRDRYDRDLPERIDGYCRSHDVRICAYSGSLYPSLLKEITTPPPVLYIKGEMPSLRVSLAVVGSRKASAYGIAAAGRLTGSMAREGLVIISGGAYGIDAAAHKAALSAGGKTIAVLGGGFEHLYPAVHRGLFRQICEHGGALVTEYAPWESPRSYYFPQRNRIIVGLSRGVLVVEAAEKSGAMITAHVAADENREVYAVPGPYYGASQKGTHLLIKEGARLVDCPEDILKDFFPEQGKTAGKIEEPSLFEQFSKTDQEQIKALYQWISQSGGQSMEAISEHFQWPFAVISMLLLRMEIAGLVRQGPGNRYLAL
jgi:DNA processing protein